MDINTLTELLSTISSNAISIKDTKNFSTKLNNIINSYKQNPSNIIFITDFDYTITNDRTIWGLDVAVDNPYGTYSQPYAIIAIVYSFIAPLVINLIFSKFDIKIEVGKNEK